MRPDHKIAPALCAAAKRAEDRIAERLSSRVKFTPRTDEETAAFRRAQRDKPRHASRREYLRDSHPTRRHTLISDI